MRAAAASSLSALLLGAPLQLGRSEQGRPIDLVRAGDPAGAPVLVVGCIHGDECAGEAVTRALARVRRGPALYLVPSLNPDGEAHGVRQDAHGVDLNRNWPTDDWAPAGVPWAFDYPGPWPFSERETRIGLGLLLRVKPRLTIWFHQHMDLVWAFGGSTKAGRLYAEVAGMRFLHAPWKHGSAVNWQNHALPGTSAFVVELPAGKLTPAQVRAQVHAVLAVAAAVSPAGTGRS